MSPTLTKDLHYLIWSWIITTVIAGVLLIFSWWRSRK